MTTAGRPTTVCVTGARGLVGREVVRQLREGGRRVLALDLAAGGPVDAGCDLRDGEGLMRILDDAGVTSVVHCGGISGPMVSGTPRDIVDINVTGTANLLDAAVALGAGRFVFASTAGVYGPDAGTIDETAPMNPDSMYGATKAAAENLVTGYRAQVGLDAVSLRFCWLYGPYRTTDCFIRDTLTDAQAGRTSTYPFGLGLRRQFLHVTDAARALLIAHDHVGRTPRAFYNAAGDASPTLDEVAGIVAQVLPGARVHLAPGGDPSDGGQGPLSTDRIAADLGFTPAIDLPTGVATYAAWLAEQERAAG
jgi:UDP-glucuronate 4-epimerase